MSLSRFFKTVDIFYSRIMWTVYAHSSWVRAYEKCSLLTRFGWISDFRLFFFTSNRVLSTQTETIWLWIDFWKCAASLRVNSILKNLLFVFFANFSFKKFNFRISPFIQSWLDWVGCFVVVPSFCPSVPGTGSRLAPKFDIISFNH